jgi:PAS domain S-box-containing protein
LLYRFNMNGGSIITINSSGVIQTVDKNCYKMFGYSMEEMIGQPVTIIIPPPYKEQHDSYIENYIKTKRAKIIGKSRIVEGQHKDGTTFPLRLSMYLLYNIILPNFLKLNIALKLEKKMMSFSSECWKLWKIKPLA